MSVFLCVRILPLLKRRDFLVSTCLKMKKFGYPTDNSAAGAPLAEKRVTYRHTDGRTHLHVEKERKKKSKKESKKERMKE